MATGIGRKRARGRGRGAFQLLPGGNLPKTGGMPALTPPTRSGGPLPVKGAAEQAMPQRERRTGRGRVGGASTPGLGRQLTSRVQSGAISQEQAQKTAQQRQLLEKAFGADWRTKVFGDAGYVRRARGAMAKNPQDPQVAALNKQLMERRQKALAAARKRIG